MNQETKNWIFLITTLLISGFAGYGYLMLNPVTNFHILLSYGIAESLALLIMALYEEVYL